MLNEFLLFTIFAAALKKKKLYHASTLREHFNYTKIIRAVSIFSIDDNLYKQTAIFGIDY